ncbi:isoleucine--tRNA ligase, cytoplasmic [Leptopilina boulardi]|uniref:isoleucine--tRNA ligase, cytoplasmic n=1 Tax=Leptopilina boulardi TaxID=63433 RepID=UPI0021F67614|nr:isoleucine--tRNA ligase, cytoplasmic [Leptopilina boulardi]
MATKLPETINFPQEEEVVLDLWNKLDVFQKCLQQSKGKPRYSFYDGPPFATGLPHYGHILAGTIKDIVTRYAHQNGYHVDRRFGWDTHGLPVEYEIDNALGIKGPDDVAKMGIANYNNECRKIVMRYATEWEKIVGRIGRWIDFKNDYKTLYPWYMETIWWVFKELFNKGLVYQGVKVVPFSTGCNTPLSNFEAGQNYKDVIDPSVVVAFPLIDEPNVSLLAWTTTPWTLPSNLALCCNADYEYLEIIDSATGKIYIILESSLEVVYKSKDHYTVKGKRKGSELKGKSYEPPFDYFAHLRKKGAFVVLNDNYVTAGSGTGIVHQAPYFGEDDYRCCLAAGIITKEQEMVCPVDNCGKFTEPVSEFKGVFVKTADKEIMKILKTKGKLIHSGTTTHSYPFCWRSDTPLLYKAVPSWFVRVTMIKDRLMKTYSETYWVPEYVKEKRFANWLENARDWAISRNRYWGNPIPLWISEDGKEIMCIGSIAELEQLTGVKITDIHRESIDNLTIPSKRPGQPPLRRISEVFDCWFESGSMPYAQMHYPFEKIKEFEESFPADFIAEGIDQTRGWFYTLLVISTALFGKAPFKNLIANGLILAGDGQKMSKRKKNYPDPMEIVNKYGADALRLYLINSPVVRGENLRFKEEGVRDVIKDVFLPWYNAFRFLIQNIERYEKAENIVFQYHSLEDNKNTNGNIMDRWIISFTQSLLEFLKQEMSAYRLYTVVPRLIKFIDNLTNWYVRMNRKRIKGDTGSDDCQRALNTLFYIVYTMCRVNAPFTPFLTEFMFQRLRKLLPMTKTHDSIHYEMIPNSSPKFINQDIEKAVACMQTVIDLGRIVRDRKTMPVKYPLPEIVVINQDSRVIDDIVSLTPYILEELNVKKLTATTDKEKYGVTLKAEPDHKNLGARLKGEFKAVMAAIKDLSNDELQKFVNNQNIVVLGHTLEKDDLRLSYSFSGPAAEQLSKQYEAHCEGNVLILLDVTPDEMMLNEGLAREIINRVQKLRKKAQLVPTDEATVYYDIKDKNSTLAKVVDTHQKFIETTTKTPQMNYSKFQNEGNIIILEEMQNIKGVEMNLVLVKGNSMCQLTNGIKPFVEFVNVHLVNCSPRFGANSQQGTILLRDFKNNLTINYEKFCETVENIFGIYGCNYQLYANNEKLGENTNFLQLHGENIFIVRDGDVPPIDNCKSNDKTLPICKFINFKTCGKEGTILLENPQGSHVLNVENLKDRLISLCGMNKISIPHCKKSVFELHGTVVEF